MRISISAKCPQLLSWLSTGCWACLLSAGVLACALPFSCRLTENGIQLLTSDTSFPTVLSFTVTSGQEVQLVCSEPVSLDSATVDERDCSVTYMGSGEIACVAIPQETEIGGTYTFACRVADRAGNTLTYTRLFSGFNSQPARLLLSEVRTETSGNNERYPEFIELYVLSSGNLWGLSLVSAKGGADKSFSFPAVAVTAGEFITVHYMSPQEGLCIDEMGTDLALSTARDSSSGARDFWLGYTASCLTKSDIILLMGQNEEPMDALAFSASESEWSGKVMTYAQLACDSGIWTAGSSSGQAVSSAAATGVRTLSRLNLKDLADRYMGAADIPSPVPVYPDDWAVVTKGSPGSWNTAAAYSRQ